MCDQAFVDELEKDIILMQQELILKSNLLTECREKLNVEVAEHSETKLTVKIQLNEIKELRIQLDLSLKALQKLEEENNKNKEILVKTQVQSDAYVNERGFLTNRCQELEAENLSLKNENSALKEQLRGLLSFEEKYKTRHLETSRLIKEIFRKQDILKKDQSVLENTCKEGLKFATKVSEESKHQAKYVQEAEKSQRKMEDEMIRLLGTVKELQEKCKKNFESENSHQDSKNSVEEWKVYYEDAKLRLEYLIKENENLNEELNLATKQINLLIEKQKKNT